MVRHFTKDLTDLQPTATQPTLPIHDATVHPKINIAIMSFNLASAPDHLDRTHITNKSCLVNRKRIGRLKTTCIIYSHCSDQEWEGKIMIFAMHCATAAAASSVPCMHSTTSCCIIAARHHLVSWCRCSCCQHHFLLEKQTSSWTNEKIFNLLLLPFAYVTDLFPLFYFYHIRAESVCVSALHCQHPSRT